MNGHTELRSLSYVVCCEDECVVIQYCKELIDQSYTKCIFIGSNQQRYKKITERKDVPLLR